ncbi:hypothetical protein THII_3209 [Thioploca ingrica]|uniref:Uncharacterized protein n=1 Tax=Thioploca ingrica TaxID=40754 RepID=A0A090BVV3_9GAMM|nr:hypothetical protein THII_3209 [Thioploca ingrica]
MTFLEEAREQSEQIKQTFLARLNQLFADIQVWVTAEGWYTEQNEIEITEKIIGNYVAPALSILTPKQQKLVDIIPTCAFVIVADGVVKISGEMGQQILVYLRPSEQTIYNIYADNWYWIEYTRDNQVHLLTKDILLKLIGIVNENKIQN